MLSIRIKDFSHQIPAVRDFSQLFEDRLGEDCLGLAEIVERELDAKNRRFRFVASDDSVDHHDEVVAEGAFHELRHVYMSNPVLLSGHQHWLANGLSPVVGRTLELRTEKNPVAGLGELVNTAVGRDHAEAIFSKAQRAMSVGFRVRETDRSAGRVTITKGLLLEISVVPVGANPNALVLEYVRGRLAQNSLSLADRRQAADWQDAVRELQAQIDRLKLGRYTPSAMDADDGDDLAEKIASAAKSIGRG